jgi:hypothetical protein
MDLRVYTCETFRCGTVCYLACCQQLGGHIGSSLAKLCICDACGTCPEAEHTGDTHYTQSVYDLLRLTDGRSLASSYILLAVLLGSVVTVAVVRPPVAALLILGREVSPLLRVDRPCTEVPEPPATATLDTAAPVVVIQRAARNIGFTQRGTRNIDEFSEQVLRTSKHVAQHVVGFVGILECSLPLAEAAWHMAEGSQAVVLPSRPMTCAALRCRCGPAWSGSCPCTCMSPWRQSLSGRHPPPYALRRHRTPPASALLRPPPWAPDVADALD